MLRMILGEAGTGKTTEVLRQIKEAAGRQQPVLLLVPEHASFEMERRVSALFTGEEQQYITLLSFPRLAEKIFRECGGLTQRPLDEVSRALLMREAISEVQERLTLYRRQAGYTGFISSMLQTVADFKRAGITPARLEEIAAETDGTALGQKLTDLQLIYEAFQALVELRFHDPLDELALALGRAAEKNWFAGRHIWVDSFDYFSVSERALLEQHGHTVVVYEKDDAIGGLMRYGIPNFKLDKRLIDRRVEQMEAEGTVFRTGVEIGKDISWDDLRSRYDAVVVAIGSTVPRDMKIPGRGLKGIHFAMEFLPDATRRVYGVKPVNDITAEGKHVVIIGGGDTGSDCLGTSLRQGAKDVTVLQIMPQEPKERPANQPWPTFARLYKETSSMEEGFETQRAEYVYNTDSVNFEGSDEDKAKVKVENSTATEGFVADENGHVTGLKVVNVAPGENGPFTRQPGTERVIPADLVLISVGFLHPDTTTLVDQLPVDLDGRGNVARNDKFATSQDGVFACGDAGRGQSLVVWAISEGRSCAAAVDEYLTGSTELPAPIVASKRPMMLPR